MFKQWQARLSNAPIMSLVLVFTLLLVTWQLVNFWQVNSWQQTLLKKLAAVEVLELKDQESDKINKTKITKAEVKPLSLVHVDLPDLPHTSASASASASKVAKVAKVAKSKNIIKNKSKPQKSIPQVKHETKSQNVSAMYQQLISDSSITIEIAWPNDEFDRKNTFSFLYQCIGMKFGVLSGQNKNNPKVILAQTPDQHITNKSSNQVSDWLRIAQGQLASQERHWLQQYSLSGTPVRLFPKAVDWQLARLLTHQLHKTPLTSFRARYRYDDNSLMLTNIKLNGELLANNWTLATSKCSI